MRKEFLQNILSVNRVGSQINLRGRNHEVYTIAGIFKKADIVGDNLEINVLVGQTDVYSSVPFLTIERIDFLGSVTNTNDETLVKNDVGFKVLVDLFQAPVSGSGDTTEEMVDGRLPIGIAAESGAEATPIVVSEELLKKVACAADSVSHPQIVAVKKQIRAMTAGSPAGESSAPDVFDEAYDKAFGSETETKGNNADV